MGRTGAGKSSLIAALFRIAEPEGKILLRGIPTASMSLRDLRSGMSIIPQDPWLFKGSLRKNLDPFDEFEDADVWDAIKKVRQSLKSLNTKKILTEGQHGCQYLD